MEKLLRDCPSSTSRRAAMLATWAPTLSSNVEIFSNSLPSICDMDVSIFSSICKSIAGQFSLCISYAIPNLKKNAMAELCQNF